MKSGEYIKRMERDKKLLITGEIYWDKKNKEAVEYCYMGKTGYAIVCQPGDSGGGMQSCWGIKPDSLESLTEKHIRQMQNKKG